MVESDCSLVPEYTSTVPLVPKSYIPCSLKLLGGPHCKTSKCFECERVTFRLLNIFEPQI